MKPIGAIRGGALVLVLLAAGATTAAASGVGDGARKAAGVATPAPKPSSLPAPPLSLRIGEIDTSVPRGGLSLVCGGAAGDRHFVIQLDGPMTPQRQTRLREAKIGLGDYLPEHAYIVTLDQADAGRVEALEFVRWWGVYERGWKLDPELGKRLVTSAANRALAEQGLIGVTIVLFDGEAAGPTLAAITKLEQASVHYTVNVAGNQEISATVRAADIGAIADLPAVQFIEEASDISERNSTDRWIVQSNVPGSTPLYDRGLHGEGQIVGVLDSALDANHCSFRDTVNPIGPAHRKIQAYNATPGAVSHGTHVSGTAVGDNGVNDDTRGVAYLGRLVYNGIPSFTESAAITRLQLHHDQGARVHTNSWGDDGTTAYNGLCRGFDSFLYSNEDSMVCLAVTNTSTLRNPENAKNLLAVGASQDTPNQGSHCSGGTGPTSDGRRKPEVYAPGCSTMSAQSGSSCGVVALTGTSMATPAVAGTAMLVRQYFAEGFYPGGVADSGPAMASTGALVKAVLVNSSVDMTGITGYPGNQEGWGRVLADDALYFAGDSRKTIVADVRNTDGISTGTSVSIPVNVLSSSERLKITLVWTEPPAAAGAANAPVNDLDLIVTSPTGQTYLGNVFAGGISATGGTRDSKNNVEQVHIDAPAPGVWSVQVTGAAVNVGLQGYSLVATGDVQAAAAGLVVSIAAAPVARVAAEVPVTIEFNVSPNADELVPGSAQLHFRYGPGPYTTVPLVTVAGTRYRATMPGARCGESPQYFATAEGVSTGVRSAPGAGAYSFVVGTLQTASITEEGFAGGLPAGWTATGLWHAASACAVTPACESAPWMAYNLDSTCTYATGAANVGSLTMPTLALPAVPGGGSISLTYCSSVQTESSTSYDLHRVFVNGTVVDTPPQGTWSTRTVDLTAFAGQQVGVRWEFDTIDSVANGFRGWQVDTVAVSATTSVCQARCLADFDRDGSVTPGDIAAFVLAWSNGVNQGTLEADADRNGACEPADIGLFVNLWFAALSGPCPS
ncbi:MAG: S8 family serine peptidase [Phycisphaeraceae bacterium]|nr:S8 family serine peptidase [Phycisphaeraceae bacterium]